MLVRSVLFTVAVFASTTAYADCRPKFNFTAGRDSRGTVQNISGGELCRIAIYRNSKASNRAMLQSAEVLKAPKRGSATVDGTSVLISMAPEFSGKDSMVVRYNYLSPEGKPMKSDVSYSLTN